MRSEAMLKEPQPLPIMRLIDQHVGGDDMLVADTGYWRPARPCCSKKQWGATPCARPISRLGVPRGVRRQARRRPKAPRLRLTGDGGWLPPAGFGNRATPETPT